MKNVFYRHKINHQKIFVIEKNSKKNLKNKMRCYFMETLGDKKRAKKGTEKYICIICDYKCSKKYSWERHLSTAKHLKLHIRDNLRAKKGIKGQKQLFTCQFCNKEYKHRQCLWRHKKISNCEEINFKNSNEGPIDKEIVMVLLQQNNELIKEHSNLKEIILEIVKNGTHYTTNNTTTHTNSHNKAFNLNFFLNETCKNAMNITEFVDSIKLQLSDFMNVGNVGFVEGISNIIVKNLNSLDETVRPIHCTDQKRETFYVKDQNQWEKEENDRKKLNKLIKSIAYKNEKLMKTYKDTFPDYNDPESKRSDLYSKTVIEAMDCKLESREKIIKNISKATMISGKLN